jgi:hypothetical protein
MAVSQSDNRRSFAPLLARRSKLFFALGGSARADWRIGWNRAVLRDASICWASLRPFEPRQTHRGSASDERRRPPLTPRRVGSKHGDDRKKPRLGDCLCLGRAGLSWGQLPSTSWRGPLLGSAIYCVIVNATFRSALSLGLRSGDRRATSTPGIDRWCDTSSIEAARLRYSVR